MNLHLPGGGLGRGRVWRSQGWAGGQPSKPWLGTLNSGLSTIGEAGPPLQCGGSCLWAAGNDLPYIQQNYMTDSADNLGDFALPLPTPAEDCRYHQRLHQQRQQQQQQQQQQSPVITSPVVADGLYMNFKRYESFDMYVHAVSGTGFNNTGVANGVDAQNIIFNKKMRQISLFLLRTLLRGLQRPFRGYECPPPKSTAPPRQIPGYAYV